MYISWPVILLLCTGLAAVVLILITPMPHFGHKASGPTRSRDSNFSRDDERYWYGGIIYHNSDDPEPLVPKRSGFGWTINFGHPAGKLILLAIVILGLVVPLAITLLGAIFPGLLHPLGCHPSGCYPAP